MNDAIPPDDSLTVFTARSIRTMEPEDFAEVEEMHRCFSEQRPFAVLRDPEHWEFVRRRADSFFSRLNSPHLQQQWQVVVEGSRLVGYLITVEGRGEWNVREVGAVEGDFGTMARILRFGARSAIDRGLRRFYAWLPHELLEHLDDWPIRARPRRGALPMVMPLSGVVELPALQVPGACYIPYQDQF